MTDYLKLAQETAPPAPPADNPYLSLVQDEQRQAQARARTVLESAFKDNPDTAAERQRLATTSGLPLRVIERNLDEVRAKEQARMVDLASMANESPVLARQLLDPTFTTTAVDDLDTLKRIERTVGHAARYVMGADGKGGLPKDLQGAAVDVGLGATAGVGEMIFNLAAVVNDALGLNGLAADARGQANASREARQAYGLQPESQTGSAVKSGLGSAGSNLAILPLGLARGAAATAEAAANLPALLMGLGVGADAYLQAREKGKSGVQAALFGIPQGTFEYVFEKIPASKLFGDIAANTDFIRTLGKQVVSEGWTEQVTTLAQDFNEWMNLNPEKTVGQFIAERPDAAYETFIATLVGVGVQTSAITAVNKVVEKATDTALTYQQDLLAEQMKLIGSSMLRQRSPEQFRAYVERIVEETDGARKEVYVDAEVLAQLPQDVLAQLPQAVQQAIPEALAANSTVAIPMVDVLTVAPGTVLEQTLNDHARMTPDAITRAEAQAAAETLRQDAERVLVQAQDQEAARAEFDAVQADLAQQIAATGRYRPQVAETYAAGLAHFFAAYGSRTGLGTQGLYDVYKARGFAIRGESSAPGQTLEAALPGTISVEGYHFSTQARSSLSTAFYGTGLKGSARDEIMANPDTRLQRRLSFYFDKGTGIRPEAGVGGIAHRANLTNIYDADADLLGLRSGDARAFESALLDRGYAGYATRMEGTQPGQVILLGDQTITPEVLGPRSSIATGERVPALPAEEARWTTVASGPGVEARAERMQASPAWDNYELRIENGELQVRPREGVFAQSRVKNATPAVRKLLKSLTPEEQTKVTDLVAAKITEVLQTLPSSKEMAAVAYAGRAKRGWYKNSADAISAVFGADAPRFAALLAAMSPQTSVENNLYNALSTWKNWVAAGRPQTKAAIVGVMGRSVMGSNLTDSVLPAWINNSVRALTNEDPGKTVLSGPKVNSFFRNLVGVVDEVTNDAWMANYALVDQKIFAGGLNAAGTEPGKRKGYLAMSVRVREAAATLTKLSGETWTPAEVQETIWSWAKTLYETAEAAGETRTARQLVQEGALTDEAINATPDFSTLFRNPTYAKILEDAGYGSRLDDLDRLAAENAASRSDAGGQAGPFAAEDQLRLELQAARRLERLADARGDASAAARQQRADDALIEAADDGRYEQAGNRGGRYSSGSLAPLAGAPAIEGASGPDPRLVAVAEQYARDNGIQLRRQGEYARVDPERAKRIAAAYEAMEHAPNDPRVRAAYEDLIQQTLAQYLALQKAGYRFTFMDPARDPYAGNPWNAMRDLRANQHMAVFPTDAGFGSGATLNIGLADPLGGPNISTARVMAALAEAGAAVKASATHESNTEPTLVVELNAPLTAEAATTLAETLGQEAIAQQRGDGSGDLFGPAAEKWGAFNPEYFLTINGKTAAATANPLLADTGLEWETPSGQLKRVLANDLFRAVHDAFGHGLEGAGFRAQGEENAWQAHVRLFTGPAVGAITSETRGQNSWLNFGPHGEKNQTAAVEDTIFADQKTGLMPEWTWTEGRVGDESDVLNQPAYHGTPHRGIDKFSLDKIGTGEGAQAYGWGLYFAESKDIAEFYRTQLSEADVKLGDTSLRELAKGVGEEAAAAQRLLRDFSNPSVLQSPGAAKDSKFWRETETFYKTAGTPETDPVAALFAKYGDITAVTPGGQTYVVEVPDATDLLDYDAPLKDQPPKVKAALEKLGFPETLFAVIDNETGETLRSLKTREEARSVISRGNLSAKIKPIKNTTLGRYIYSQLMQQLGSDKAASLALRDAGIPGLRYLDASSRGARAKSQSRNFVIFDESAVQKTGELYQRGDVTQTEAFKKWFGDSKVVDKSGRPLVVYHGTDKDFVAFDPATIGKTWGDRAGFYFTDSPADAQAFGSLGADKVARRKVAPVRVMPLYLSLQNPLRIEGRDGNYGAVQDDDVWDAVKSGGHDGIIMRTSSGAVLYVAFRPEQIKSAIGNDGTFDPTDPNVVSQQARGTFNPKTLELVLNPNTDLSTLWHEMGHFFLEVLQDVATQPNAPAQIAADYQTVLGWFGVTDEQWRAFSLDEKRKYHERWAESIEQYVMEGKVPNAELAPLMRRFAAWLKSVYTSVQKFLASRPDAEKMGLNDDVRRVMDRMLATDEQIAQAEESAGLVFDEDATAAAQERLRKRSMADLKWTVKARDKIIRELQKKAKNLRKQIEAEITEEANALPVYAAKEALAALEKQHEADPFSADMNTAAVADAFGFETVDAMYRAIDQAGEKQDYIDGRTEQRMLEEHGDLMNDDAIRAAANEAVHNDARARSLASELRTQAELLGTRNDTGQTTAKGAKVTTSALVEAAKQFGANVIARTPLRDLKNKAWQHTAAERRASKAWQAATAAGKTVEAVQAKQDQVLNHAAAKAAIEAQAEAKKIAEFFARVLKGNDEKTVEKGRDPDIVNAARAVLGLYGMQSAASKTAAEYLKAVKANDPDAWSAIEDMVETASANAQPLSALTFEQLQGLHEQIEGMWFLAKRSRQMEVDGDLLDIEDAAADLGKRMDEIGVPDTVPGEAGALTKAEQRTRSIRFFGAALKRVEQWTEGMDGKYGGPFLRYIFQPIKDAADAYRSDRLKYRKKFQALVNKIAPSMRHELIEAPELGYTFGRGHNGIGSAELLHALLHTGNDSNKRKLLLGRGWATEGPDGQLDTGKWDAFVARLVAEGKLTTAHYDFLQGVWDLLEETKPLAQKAHRDVFGRYFAEVTATPFVDPFGAARRGGYVPAQADAEIVPDATLRSLAEMENESMAYSFPTTNKGFTKSRVEYNRPLKLDLRTLPQHLDKVLLFSHMEPAVRGVSKLLRQKGVSQPLNRIDPTAYAGTLLPWLNRAGKQIVETPIMGDGKTSRVLSVLRARAGAALMFANVSNTVQQITGLSSAAVKVKPSHLMRAVANVIAHPKQARQAVWDASSYMAERASNEVSAMNGQLEAILLNPSALEKAQTWTSQHAYFLQTAFDNVLSPIVWTGAYNQAVEEGMTEDQAVKFADGVVRQTQGSTLPEDVSRIETGSPAVRMFTQFIGYFNMLANTNATALKQIAQETGLRKGAGRALGVVLMGVLMPIWIAEAIAQAFRGGPDDEDKDGYLDDWLAAIFGMGTIKGVLAQVPFIGQLANAGIARLNNNPADDKMSLSPAVSLLEGAVGSPVSVYKAIVEEGSARKAVRDVASLVSIALGLPATAIARPIGYAAGVEEGRIKPTGPVDAARGAITGAASPASR